jgi:hypothetical protein
MRDTSKDTSPPICTGMGGYMDEMKPMEPDTRPEVQSCGRVERHKRHFHNWYGAQKTCLGYLIDEDSLSQVVRNAERAEANRACGERRCGHVH